MKVAVVGLGVLGEAIGGHLIRDGFEVLGVDPVSEVRDRWVSTYGASAVPGVDALPWPEIGAVVIVVRLTDQVADVLAALPADGPPGRPCLIVSTLEPSFAARLGEWETPFALTEFPVSGGPHGAASGQLLGMASDDLGPEAAAVAKSLCAKVITFCGFGQPTIAKLINNVTMAYNTAVGAQMLAIGERLGLGLEPLHQVLLHGSGRSFALERLPGTILSLLYKDVRLLADHIGELAGVVPGEGFVAEIENLRARLVD